MHGVCASCCGGDAVQAPRCHPRAPEASGQRPSHPFTFSLRSRAGPLCLFPSGYGSPGEGAPWWWLRDPWLEKGPEAAFGLSEKQRRGRRAPCGSRTGVEHPRPEARGQAAGPLGFWPCGASRCRGCFSARPTGRAGRRGRPASPVAEQGHRLPEATSCLGSPGWWTSGVDSLACAPVPQREARRL